MTTRRAVAVASLAGLLLSAEAPALHVPGDAAPLLRVALSAGQAGPCELGPAIQAELDRRLNSADGRAQPSERRPLADLYARTAGAALWVDASGLPNDLAREALTLSHDAAAEGLDPNDYEAAGLAALSAAIAADGPSRACDAARLEIAVSAGMLRYFHDIHIGRIDPRAIGFHMDAPADAHDFAALLQAAVSAHRLPQAAAELAPDLPQYRNLKRALATYRALAADPGLAGVPISAKAIRPGAAYPSAPALRRLLIAFGDLPADARVPADATSYDGDLVDGVKRFQRRHGLEQDGVLGKATQMALSIPIAWRVRQIELALERLRWLPHLPPGPRVILNIPLFHLWVWDKFPTDPPVLDMNVIVGRALNTQTPIFPEQMEYLVFRPYWNIPPSILRNEVLPAQARNRGYLRAHDMEIVRGNGDNAAVPVDATPENIALVRQGAYRIRQRPGPQNALGAVKFVFPNDDNVYMHGTPARELFSRARRDFSHGCVRVENPVALAEWALGDQPEWTSERIFAAMNDGEISQRVKLTRPIPVILYYITAVVTPDGLLHFAEDIYGHDARLDRALRSR